MFVGGDASRVRDMFDQAKRQSPCIVHEIDAVEDIEVLVWAEDMMKETNPQSIIGRNGWL